MTYTIGEVAKIMDVSPSTLRFYEKEGLLPFVDRSTSGIRVFKDADFEWLHLIECLKHSGMPLKEIRQFIQWYFQGDATLENRRDLFQSRKELVQQQMVDLQQTLDILTYKCWFYDQAVALGSAEAAKEIKPEDMPEDMRRFKDLLTVQKT